MSPSTPIDDERTAYRVAALPLEYGMTRINQLFTRCYNRYVVDGENQPEDLLTDIEQFGLAVFKEQVRADATNEPFVDEPGILAVLTTLSAICVKEHPKFDHSPPRTIQVLYDIRELYVNNLPHSYERTGMVRYSRTSPRCCTAKIPARMARIRGEFARASKRCQSSETDYTSKSRWLWRHGNISSVRETVRRQVQLTAGKF